jgi:serpin B
MKTSLVLPFLLGALSATQLHAAAPTDTAANAINALGIDLLRKTGGPDENALLSPYSIQEALAMAYAGAAGKTREEMMAVLHFPKESADLDKSFGALDKELAAIEVVSREKTANSAKFGGPSEPVTLSIANRLYAQKGYDFRAAYLESVKQDFDAPVEQADFKRAADAVRTEINGWVAERTRKRIEDLIPPRGLDETTRLVLVNAIYLTAAWRHEFAQRLTDLWPFHVNGGATVKVPTMSTSEHLGYANNDGYTAVAIPYVGSQLQLVVLLPDRNDGLAALEAKLTPAMLAACADLKPDQVNLWLPKFKIEPAPMELSESLEALGMKTAFDVPQGSADFDAMAPRKPDDYLYISKVFHKTFLSLDEHGTEAAAATAVVMLAFGAKVPDAPRKIYAVRVDHPFLFAIQDCKSGACLFLGRVTDPR